jgi:glycopeptide antibiotics resistance protein
MFKKDNLRFGLILGFLSPVLGMSIYYLMRFRLFSVKDFLRVLMMQKSLMSGVVSVALLANAIVFTIYINKHKDNTAKGIFIATCIYALLALGLKWFA